MAIGFLAQAGFVFVSQGAIRYPGLAFLVASGDPMQDAQDPLVPLLSSIDLFWLWHLLLVVLGLSVVARLKLTELQESPDQVKITMAYCVKKSF